MEVKLPGVKDDRLPEPQRAPGDGSEYDAGGESCMATLNTARTIHAGAATCSDVRLYPLPPRERLKSGYTALNGLKGVGFRLRILRHG